MTRHRGTYTRDERTWVQKSREEQTAEYDYHNKGMRMSPDVGHRIYGSCGCNDCRMFRDAYIAPRGHLNPVNRRGIKMGSINVCDRCPAMIKGNALGSIQIVTSSDTNTSETVYRELCPGCVEEILTLTEMEPVERTQRAYDKPFVRKPEEDAVDQATSEQLAAALLEKLMKEAKANVGRQIESSAE